MAIVAVLIVWIVVVHTRPGPVTFIATPQQATTTTVPATATINPVVLDRAALVAHVAALTQPVYWIGSQRARRFELRRSPDGSVILRYLPPGVPPGSNAAVISIGTYPLANAFAVTSELGQQKGNARARRPDGAVAVYRTSRPTNVYVAYPRSAYQVEVFSPDPAEARKIALSSSLEPIAH
jgi:hypothetical protein